MFNVLRYGLSKQWPGRGIDRYGSVYTRRRVRWPRSTRRLPITVTKTLHTKGKILLTRTILHSTSAPCMAWEPFTGYVLFVLVGHRRILFQVHVEAINDAGLLGPSITAFLPVAPSGENVQLAEHVTVAPTPSASIEMRKRTDTRLDIAWPPLDTDVYTVYS